MDVMLVLTVFLTQNMKGENLFCNASSTVESSSFFWKDFNTPCQDGFQHHFACLADQIERFVILTQLEAGSDLGFKMPLKMSNFTLITCLC